MLTDSNWRKLEKKYGDDPLVQLNPPRLSKINLLSVVKQFT